MLKEKQNEYARKYEELGRNSLRKLFSNPDMYRIYFADYEKDEVDFILFTQVGTKAGDIKCYRNKDYIRYHDHLVHNGKTIREYPDYELDADKLENIAIAANVINATPILVVFFADQVMIWDLSKTNWRNTLYLREGNKYGSDPTIKELTPKAKLFFEDAIYINNKINMFS